MDRLHDTGTYVALCIDCQDICVEGIVLSNAPSTEGACQGCGQAGVETWVCAIPMAEWHKLPLGKLYSNVPI